MTVRLSTLPAALAWANQFSSADRDVAVQLLDALVLVSLSAVHRSLTGLMESLVHGEGTCAFYAVRELEDGARYFPNKKQKPDAVPTSAVGSEGVVAQIITKLAAATRDGLDHPPIMTLRRRRVNNIVLVDDVCLSGNRTSAFIRALMLNASLRSWASYGKLSIHIVAYAVSREAEHRIAGTIARWTRIPREGRLRFHVEQSSIAGYRNLDETLHGRLRSLCTRYPPTLTRPDAGARMGYGNTMSTTVFQHGCPNNVPAMLWATAAGWAPLFPGRQVPASLFPAFAESPNPDREARLSAMLAAEDGASNGDQSDVTRVLKALRRRKLREGELVHATGLGTLSVRLVLRQCLRFGLVSSADGRTTPKGNAELRRLGRRESSYLALDMEDQPVYIPGALRGSRDRI